MFISLTSDEGPLPGKWAFLGGERASYSNTEDEANRVQDQVGPAAMERMRHNTNMHSWKTNF